MYAVEVNNLSKAYKKIQAIDDISFTADYGELLGFIGPDGAGKTTIFRILTTLILPDKGKATVLGLDAVKDYKELRKRLGYMPGRFSLYQDLTVEENINFFASIFNTSLDENYDLIKDIYSQIEPFKDRKAGKLSGGMKQKLALSCALIHKPELLILDEPTTGVDAVSRREFWEMLKKLKEQGITIIVSTPYMDEAILCERVALIQNRKIMDIAKPDKIIEKFHTGLYAIESSDKFGLINALKSYEYAQSVYPFGDSVHYTDKRKSVNMDELSNYLKSKGIIDAVVRETKPNIEDTFMYLMERKEHE